MLDSDKPNVVYILTDQWRAKATGYNGDPTRIPLISTNSPKNRSILPMRSVHRPSVRPLGPAF